MSQTIVPSAAAPLEHDENETQGQMTQRHKKVSPQLWCSMPVHSYLTLLYEPRLYLLACAGAQIPQGGHEEAGEEAEGVVLITQAQAATW